MLRNWWRTLAPNSFLISLFFSSNFNNAACVSFTWNMLRYTLASKRSGVILTVEMDIIPPSGISRFIRRNMSFNSSLINPATCFCLFVSVVIIFRAKVQIYLFIVIWRVITQLCNPLLTKWDSGDLKLLFTPLQ